MIKKSYILGVLISFGLCGVSQFIYSQRFAEAMEAYNVPENDNRTSNVPENEDMRQGETPEQGETLPP
jgi:hypothetical protein